IGEPGDQRGVEEVPFAVEIDFGHNVGDDGSDACLQAGVARQGRHFAGSHAAVGIAIDVDHLDGVVDGAFILQEFGGGAVLVLEGGDGLPGGHGSFLVAYAWLDEGGLPGVEAGDVGDFVGEDFDVGDDGGLIGAGGCGEGGAGCQNSCDQRCELHG